MQRHTHAVPFVAPPVLDNKRVQAAGCNAFGTLEEDAGSVALYIELVLRNLVLAFDEYQHDKNMLILYHPLTDAVGGTLENRAYVEIIMPIQPKVGHLER